MGILGILGITGNFREVFKGVLSRTHRFGDKQFLLRTDIPCRSFEPGIVLLVGGLDHFLFSHSVGNVIIPMAI